MFRILIFLKTQDVGVEHDSAWYLGVAKNISKYGLYASNTNTSILSTTVSPSIHNRYSVQDKVGRSYFPGGVTVGLGYMLPQAIIMKFFGFGFWQYRAIPLLGFLLMLILLLHLAYTFGGYFSLALFTIILWFRPDIYINYSFEGFSEQLALAYILISITLLQYFFTKSLTKNKILLSGLVFGMAIATKYLSAMYLPCIFIFFWPRNEFKISKLLNSFRLYFSFILGALFPIVLFFLYQYVFMNLLFGKLEYMAIIKDFTMHWQTGGGGFGRLDLGYILTKSQVLENLGNVHYLFYFIILVLTPIFLFKKSEINAKKIYLLGFYLMFLVNYIWFSFLAWSGWLRHTWVGLILLVLLMTIIFSHVLMESIQRSMWSIYMTIIGIIILSIIFNESANISPVINKSYVNYLWSKNIIGLTPNTLQGFVFSPIFSWKDLQEVVKILNGNKVGSKRLYYAGTFLVTEVATETMRPIFPIARILDFKEDGLLIIGPYQKGDLSLVNPEYESLVEKNFKAKKIYQNNSYSLYEISYKNLLKLKK
ncbi:MAG: hypothetical protein U0525_03800 [Patescibacteria group bacterium]